MKTYRINIESRPEPEKGSYDSDLWNWLLGLLWSADIHISEDKYLDLPDTHKIYWVLVDESKEV